MDRHRRRFVMTGVVLAGAVSFALSAGGQEGASGAGASARSILLLGGTGRLGSEIAKLLVQHGDQVTIFTRPGSDRRLVQDLPVRFVEGDLRNPADISAAFTGRRYDAVISAVRVEDGDARFYQTFLPALTAEMKKHGVPHFLHSGAVGAGSNADRFRDQGWERVPGLLDRLADQGAGEEAIKRSGVPYTIIRNTRLWPEGTPPTGKAELTEDQSVVSPMTRADLARLTVECIGDSRCMGKTFHVQDRSLTWPPPEAQPAQPPEGHRPEPASPPATQLPEAAPPSVPQQPAPQSEGPPTQLPEAEPPAERAPVR